MEEIKCLLQELFQTEFVLAVLSNPREKKEVLKIKVRPVKIKGRLLFQCEAFTRTQVFHENLEKKTAIARVCEYMKEFRQMQIQAGGALYTVLVSKKGRVTIRKKQEEKERKPLDLSHDRGKHYILQEGIPVPFLIDLGVMTREGNIVKARFDKFRQINRFLEFIEDVLPLFDQDREITILDFGCGKSYLTFALYYYLHEIKQYDVCIVGLDLKKDVIEHCNALSRKYGYEKLTFLEGDIAKYDGMQKVDMVVTLHACDTATDFALAKAVGWEAKVILSVPCCQHELNGQIRNEILSPIMEYGLLKEKFSALLTDGLRAKYLESVGYAAQVLEFIDMEHTPKNILLRAVRMGKPDKVSREKILACEEFFQVKPLLGRLLDNYGEI